MSRRDARRVPVGCGCHCERVALTQAEIDELWRIACEDAGYDPEGDDRDTPMLLIASKASIARDERNAYFDPGAEVTAKHLPLTDDELRRLREAEGRHRIAVAADADEAVMLALMRWGLEHACQFDEGRALMHFYGYVLDTLGNMYGPVGAGSVLIGNLIPGEEDANAASAALVTRTFGPQFGRLHGPFGPLFRPAEKGSHESLPKRMVAFASLHPEAFLNYAAASAYLRDSYLRDVDNDGPAWWEALLADHDLRCFRSLIPYFTPTPDEIESAPAPVEAWRPLAELLRRAQARAIQVMG